MAAVTAPACSCPPGDRDLACPWHSDWDDLTADGKRFRMIAREGTLIVDPWTYVPCARSHPGLGDRVCIRENGHDNAHVVGRQAERLGFLAGKAPAEAVYLHGPAAEENVECTPEEFAVWYVALSPARQVEVAEHLLMQSRDAHRCFQANHEGRLRALEAGYREAMTENLNDQPEPVPAEGTTDADTAEVPVETPAKDETTVEVDSDAAGPDSE